MSRYYSMSVTITGALPDRFTSLMAAASAEWGFDDWDSHEGILLGSGDAQLFGGETEQQFTERLTKAIWRANGGPCRVEVTATYLDELPCESYSLGADDYDRLMNSNQEASHEEPG